MRIAKAMSGPRIRGSSTSSKARARPPRARGPGRLAGAFSRNTEPIRGLADTGPSFKQRSIHFPNRLAAQQAANLVWETVGVKRFAQKTVEAGRARFQDLLLAGLRRDSGPDGLFQAARVPHFVRARIPLPVWPPAAHADRVHFDPHSGK